MKIDCGKYVLYTDANENHWIEELYDYKVKNKEGIEEDKQGYRRVAGFVGTFEALARDFLKRKLSSDESDCLEKVLDNLVLAEREIDEIYLKYKNELKGTK